MTTVPRDRTSLAALALGIVTVQKVLHLGERVAWATGAVSWPRHSS
jgi:hypothetical protein